MLPHTLYIQLARSIVHAHLSAPTKRSTGTYDLNTVPCVPSAGLPCRLGMHHCQCHASTRHIPSTVTVTDNLSYERLRSRRHGIAVSVGPSKRCIAVQENGMLVRARDSRQVATELPHVVSLVCVFSLQHALVCLLLLQYAASHTPLPYTPLSIRLLAQCECHALSLCVLGW